jgi:hypothetical protein
MANAESIAPEFAVNLVLRRRRTRRKLSAWSRWCGFEPALHHRLLIRKLTEVWYGKIKRLMVFMPPGSAKSTYCSVLFPPWYIQAHPTHSILAASHTSELAEKWGRRVRNLIDEHGPVLKLQFCNMVARLMPRDVEVTVAHIKADRMSDDELMEIALRGKQIGS